MDPLLNAGHFAEAFIGNVFLRKSDDFGPEGTYLSIPVYRFYSVKLSLNF